MPLLPISTGGAKLWVEIDGRAQDKMKRCAVATGCCCCCCCDFDVHGRNPWKSFASLMHDRSTYISWSAHACRARPSQCVHTAISRHAVEVCIDMPRPQASDTRAPTPLRNRYFTGNECALVLMQLLQAMTHIGLLGQQAEVDFIQVNGSCSTVNKLWRRRGMRSSSALKTVVDPDSLGWVTCFNLYAA
jgi:hypothetical protein